VFFPKPEIATTRWVGWLADAVQRICDPLYKVVFV
jgi:hypothetical protein